MNAGVLTAGRALPPIRAFAGELGVNPNTVSAAYQTLRRRGVVETAGRRGTRVRPRLGSALREDIAVAVPESARDLSSGNPDPKLLPALGGPLGDAVRGAEPVLYGQPADDGELHRVATESFRVDGVPDGTVAVAGGTLDAVEKALLTRLRPGDRVAVEDPGWHALLDLLGLLGLEPHGVSVDDEGPLPDELAGALGAGARAAVVTSRAQNPFGSALGGQRAEALRGVLAAHPEVLLVEDDHGFAFTSAPFHSLARQPGTGCWCVRLRSPLAPTYASRRWSGILRPWPGCAPGSGSPTAGSRMCCSVPRHGCGGKRGSGRGRSRPATTGAGRPCSTPSPGMRCRHTAAAG